MESYIYLFMNKNLIFGLVVAACLISAVILTQKVENKKDQFNIWKEKFTVTWGSEEDSYRRMIFSANLKRIAEHNADETQSYKLGVNQFTAFTDA